MTSDHPDDVRLRAILLNEGTLATPLFLICYKQWGEEFFGWESETLDLEIEDTWKEAKTTLKTEAEARYK